MSGTNAAEAEPRSPRQWQASVRLRVRRGEPGSGIASELMERGLPPELARRIVEDAIRSARSGPTVMLVVGIVAAVLGALVTMASYLGAASRPHGGTFLIWWGPVVFGMLAFFVGLARLLRVRW